MGSPSCVHYYYGVMHSTDVAIGQELCHTLTQHIGGTITYVEDRTSLTNSVQNNSQYEERPVQVRELGVRGQALSSLVRPSAADR